MGKIAIAAGWLRHVSIAVSQQHHRDLVEPFRRHLPQDGVALDVGAHAGQFSKLLSKMAPQGVVHAFEPSAYARSILAPALRLNRISNVVVHPVGLSDEPGELVLHTPIKSRGGMGFGTAHLGADPGGAISQTVTLTTLDSFVSQAQLSRLDFIKADIEGWEAQMLRGASATIERFRPAIYLEVDDRMLNRAGASPDVIWAMLEPLGYRARLAPSFEPAPTYRGQGDYLFSIG